MSRNGWDQVRRERALGMWGDAGKVGLRGPDLNRRPSGYEPDELPDCSTPQADAIQTPPSKSTRCIGPPHIALFWILFC